MAAAVDERTSVVLLCTPNNPTGPVLTTAEVETFSAKVPRDVLVVIDEAYQEFVRNPEAVDGIEMYRKHPNVAVLRTFSKAHGLANLRVGYSVAQQRITRHLRVVATPFAVSSVAEDAAVASLAHYDEVVEKVQSLVDERTRVVDGLGSWDGRFRRPRATSCGWPWGRGPQEFSRLAEEHALSVRAFATRESGSASARPRPTPRFLEICRSIQRGPGFPSRNHTKKGCNGADRLGGQIAYAPEGLPLPPERQIA